VRTGPRVRIGHGRPDAALSPYCNVAAPACGGGETCRLIATVDGTSWGACAP
jgi:hypothetical protein